MLNEVGMLREIVVLAVLKDKDALLLQQILLKNEIGDARQILQGIRGIGKDEVELLMTTLQKAKYIAANRDAGLSIQLLQTVLYKTVMVGVLLYTNHLLATSREQFQRDAARAGKQIEGGRSVEVDIPQQHVEDILFRKVGGRPRLERARNLKMPAFIDACNDSQCRRILDYNPFT